MYKCGEFLHNWIDSMIEFKSMSFVNLRTDLRDCLEITNVSHPRWANINWGIYAVINLSLVVVMKVSLNHIYKIILPDVLWWTFGKIPAD